jgi:hypothetical protein
LPEVADLIARGTWSKRGAPPKGMAKETENYVFAVVRAQERYERARSGGTLPRNSRRKRVDDVMTDMVISGELTDVGKETRVQMVENIVSRLERGKRRYNSVPVR